MLLLLKVIGMNTYMDEIYLCFITVTLKPLADGFLVFLFLRGAKIQKTNYVH